MNKKILALLILPGISILVWFLNFLITAQAFNTNLLKTYLGNIFGILAFSFMSVNFILAGRFNSIEKIFGGYDKVYKWHLYTGRIVGALILLHPLMLMWRSVFGIDSFFTSLVTYFIPSFNNLAFTLGIISFWGVNFLILLTIGVKLPYHIWKQSHRLFIVVFILAGLHGFLNVQNESFLYNSWFLFIFILGIFAFVHREVIYEIFSAKHFKVKNIKVMQNLVEIMLDDESKNYKFVPAQFVFVSIKNNPKISSEPHPFTISSAPGENIRFSIKSLGDWTSELKYVQKGDKITLLGPHGMFGQNEDGMFIFPNERRSVFLAGGIGITPFLSILRSLANTALTAPIYVVYSCKNSAEAVYLDELNNLSSQNPSIKIIHHCSDEEGYINLEYLKANFGNDLGLYNFMICGPKAMIYSVIKILKNNNVSEKQISFEDFSFK